jgi:hypothetical protein
MDNIQVFLSATEIDKDLMEKLPPKTVFTVENGTIKSLT